jgi:hypothetical protein
MTSHERFLASLDPKVLNLLKKEHDKGIEQQRVNLRNQRLRQGLVAKPQMKYTGRKSNG